MKRTLLALLLALILPTAALAAGSAITIGVTPFPHKDIMVVMGLMSSTPVTYLSVIIYHLIPAGPVSRWYR